MSRPEPSEESSPAIEALLHYLIDTGDKPASYGGVSSAEAEQKRQGKYQEYKMPVYDGRAIVDRLSLEHQGFIFVKHETKVKDFFDEAEVRSVYYPETEQLVKENSGAKRVLVVVTVFDRWRAKVDHGVVSRELVLERGVHRRPEFFGRPWPIRHAVNRSAIAQHHREFAVIAE